MLVLHQMVPGLLVFHLLLHAVRCVFFSVRRRCLAFGQRHVVVCGYALKLEVFGTGVGTRLCQWEAQWWKQLRTISSLVSHELVCYGGVLLLE